MTDVDAADDLAGGQRVVITRGLLAGIEANVVRRAGGRWFPRYLVELDTAAPRWAAIRQTRAAAWALAPVGADAPAGWLLHRRRRVAIVDLLAATSGVPTLFWLWTWLPPAAVVLGVGGASGLAALHAVDRPRRRPA